MLSVIYPASSGRLTRYQQQVSTRIKQALPEIPDVISEIIGTYVFDYSLAGQALIFSGDGEVLNPDVRAMIKLALMSDDCEVSIKQLIFDNMRKCQAEQARMHDAIEGNDKTQKRIHFYKSDFYNSAMSKISTEIYREGGRINLDDVYVEGVSLSGEFNKLTAQRAVFKQVTFSHSRMRDANLTGATLDSSEFFAIDLCGTVAVDLICKGTIFDHTEVNNLLTNDLAMLRSGHWEYPRHAKARFTIECITLTTTNQDKVKAFRLPDSPPPPQPGCLVM